MPAAVERITTSSRIGFLTTSLSINKNRGIRMKNLFILILFVSLISMFACAEKKDSAQVAPASPEGMFVTQLPSADGMGRAVILQLFENKNALRTYAFLGKPQGDYIEEGTWNITGDAINVVLKNTANPPQDVALSFKLVSDGLISIKYDETPSGKTVVKFTRVPESL
jgi:hypothetical protein